MSVRRTARELFLFLAIEWNGLPSPRTAASVARATARFLQRHGSTQVDVDGLSLGDVLEVKTEFEDVDYVLFRDLLCGVGASMGLDYLQFIGRYFYAAWLVDSKRLYSDALAEYERVGQHVFDELSEQWFEANRGLTLMHLGRAAAAAAAFQRGIELTERTGDLHSRGMYLQNLGVAARQQDQLERTLECYEQAYAISQRIGDEYLDIRRMLLRSISKDLAVRAAGFTPESRYVSNLEKGGVTDGTLLVRPLRLFCCHTSADKETVRAVVDQIRGADIEPWLDESRLRPGEAWEDRIETELRGSDAVAIFLSRRFLGSNGYGRRELALAHTLAADLKRPKWFLIPILLDDCEIPAEFISTQCLRWSDENGPTLLAEALLERARVLGLERAPT